MKTFHQLLSVVLISGSVHGFAPPARANVLVNGGFESGLAGWTVDQQTGSDGGFASQTGTLSPVNGFMVPAPPEGANAAMTDAGAGGGHVLYQDFTVPQGTVSGSVGFSLFINNGADNFYNPGHLDWAATGTPGSNNLNQQVRVDILSPSADVFGVTVLQNLVQTNPGDALVAGYNAFSVDISSVLQANAGGTLRLRFAETDNVSFLNLGVDNVSVIANIPLPSAFWLAFSGLSGLIGLRYPRKSRCS